MNAKFTTRIANTVLLTGLVALISAAPALAQSPTPIVITEQNERSLIGTQQVIESFLSNQTGFGQPQNAAAQALAAQSGANQIWDLSGLGFDAPISFINTFFEFDPNNPADPGASVPAYQGANCVGLATMDQNPNLPGDNWAYFFIGNNRLEQHGNLTEIGATTLRIEQVPPALARDFPVEFNKTWGNTFQRTIVGGPGGMVAVTEDYTVDGWGTLILPGGIQEPALRIFMNSQVAGLPVEPSIQFVTLSGNSAGLGFDLAFQTWASVSYDLLTVTGPNPCGDDPGNGEDGGILFVVDDAGNLNDGDTKARDLMTSMDLDVMVVSDDAVTTEDADGKDLVVISGTADPSVTAADWSATAVPVLTWEVKFFDPLQLTGSVQDTDYGLTNAASALILTDASHPIANGASGTFTVANSDFQMNFGVPTNAASIVATSESGSATIFTYDTGDMLEDGSNAPARRVALYMDENGPRNATDDGVILFENAILWALGREAEIANTVAVESRDGAVPDAFVLDQNYPNPFNPNTVIPFSVAELGPVSIVVYNVLGQEVAVLVDESLAAGNYTADFRANGLPSGVYLYRLKAGSTVVTRKMLLMK